MLMKNMKLRKSVEKGTPGRRIFVGWKGLPKYQEFFYTEENLFVCVFFLDRHIIDDFYVKGVDQ